jgi:hypothetical protein
MQQLSLLCVSERYRDHMPSLLGHPCGDCLSPSACAVATECQGEEQVYWGCTCLVQVQFHLQWALDGRRNRRPNRWARDRDWGQTVQGQPNLPAILAFFVGLYLLRSIACARYI